MMGDIRLTFDLVKLLSNLSKKILILAAAVILPVLTLIVWEATFPTYKFVTITQTDKINYWESVTPQQSERLQTYIIATVFMVFAVIIGIAAWRQKGKFFKGFVWLLLLLSSIAVGFIVLAITMFGRPHSGTVLQHVQNVEFNGQAYQLGLAVDYHDDFIVKNYLVFKCDDLKGNSCQQIIKLYDEPMDNDEAELVVKDTYLWLKQGSKETQIAS